MDRTGTDRPDRDYHEMTPAPARLELNKSLARVQHKSPKRSKVFFFFFRRVGSVGEHLFCFFLFSFFFFLPSAQSPSKRPGVLLRDTSAAYWTQAGLQAAAAAHTGSGQSGGIGTWLLLEALLNTQEMF